MEELVLTDKNIYPTEEVIFSQKKKGFGTSGAKLSK